MSGHRRWQHRRPDPLAARIAARTASCVQGRHGAARAPRSSHHRPHTARVGTRAGATPTAQAGGEGCGHAVALGGFQSAVRVARDPSRFRRQGRLGVGRKPCAGTVARAVGRGSSQDVDLELVSSSHRRQGRGQSRRVRCRQRCWTGLGRKRHGEGHPPGTAAGKVGTSAPIVRTQRESRGGGNTVVSRGSVAPTVRRFGNFGRSSVWSGSRRSPGPACRTRHTTESCGATSSRRLGGRASACRSPAHSQRLRVVSAGRWWQHHRFPYLWVIGRVQPAVCRGSVDVGVRVEVARCSWRAERAGLGSFTPRFGCVGSPALSGEHAGPSRAWQHVRGAENLRR